MLEKEKFEITYADRKAIQDFIKPLWVDAVSVKNLELIMK